MTSTESSASEELPWTARVYALAPLSPSVIGLLLGAALIVMLLVSEWILGRYTVMLDPGAGYDPLPDFRIAVVHCLLIAYAPTAYVVLILRTRRTWGELQNLLRLTDVDLRVRIAAVGRRQVWQTLALVLAAVCFWIWITYATTPAPNDPFSLSEFSPENTWHRVLGAPMIAYVILLCVTITRSSWMISAAARRIPELDLLDRGQLAPFRSQALTQALLVLGAAACGSPLGYEPNLVGLTIGMASFAMLIATIGLMLPLLGVRERIRATKSREIDWCDVRLRSARDALKQTNARVPVGEFSELYAYRRCLDEVRDWALDTPSFVRFALYLLIPIGSWLGGALVERLVDAAVR